jgi:glycosyltransferase involved in cell wall biosynthesis
MKNEVETLVILSPGFPENEADSTCMPSQQVFVKALKEVCPGLNIIVLAFQYPFTAREYQWHGVRVISLGGKNKGKLSHMGTWIKAWLVLRKLNKENTLIGLLSFWFGECAYVGDKFAKRHKLSHYSWLLGQDAKRGNKYVKRVKPKGDSLIALSDFLAKEFKFNYGVAPFHIIPSGIDTTLFGPEPIKRDIDVLGAGSLIPLKQYHLFVECIASLKNLFPGIHAVVCGKGPELEKLQAMVASLNLENNISFIGELPHTEVLALMQRSKVFLHPSNYEGFSTVLAEALYAGAHVVSFCKPMAKDFRHHHVVKTTAEMNAEVLALLNNKQRGHDPVLTHPAHQIAKNVISLFADSSMVN